MLGWYSMSFMFIWLLTNLPNANTGKCNPCKFVKCFHFIVTLRVTSHHILSIPYCTACVYRESFLLSLLKFALLWKVPSFDPINPGW